MATRRSTKMKIMVTSPELEDTILLAAEGHSRLSSKDSFGKISLNSAPDEGQSMKKTSPVVKSSKKAVESIEEESSIVRFAIHQNVFNVSGETDNTTETSDPEESMMNWKRDDNISEMMIVQKKLGLKPAMIRPNIAVSSEDENSESDISIDGDEVIPAEMLQTWETGSIFSQAEDDAEMQDV